MYRLTATDSIIRLADIASIPADPANRDYAEYLKWIAAGGVPEPYVEPTIQIDKVTMAQARLVLLNAGLLETVQQLIDAGDESLKIEWEYRTEVRRDAPLVVALASQLNLTDEQVDALFEQAATL